MCWHYFTTWLDSTSSYLVLQFSTSIQSLWLQALLWEFNGRYFSLHHWPNPHQNTFMKFINDFLHPLFCRHVHRHLAFSPYQQEGIRFNTVNIPALRYFLVHPCPRGNINQYYPLGWYRTISSLGIDLFVNPSFMEVVSTTRSLCLPFNNHALKC